MIITEWSGTQIKVSRRIAKKKRVYNSDDKSEVVL